MPSSHQFPFCTDQVDRLQELLVKMAPFVANLPQPSDMYNLEVFLTHHAIGGSRISALLDRNLFSRILDMAKGKNVDTSKTSVVAAATMAFLIAAKVEIEFNICIYEGISSTRDRPTPDEEIKIFHIANNIHPTEYAEIALGNSTRISKKSLDDAQTTVSNNQASRKEFVDKPLTEWKRHRLILTKIVLLERDTSLARLEKLKALFQWSMEASFHDEMAIVFATIYFSENRPGKMFKKALSGFSNRCKKSIENTSWDLTYVSYWVRWSRSDHEKTWMFCSYDHVLLDIARARLSDTRRSLFAKYWESADDVNQIISGFEEVENSIKMEGERRRRDVSDRHQRIDQLQASLDLLLDSIIDRDNLKAK